MNEREILERAIAIRDDKQRNEYLEQVCKGDVALRKSLDELLASREEASGNREVTIPQPSLTSEDLLSSPTIQLSRSHETTDSEEDEVSQESDFNFLLPSEKPGSIGRLGHYEILRVLGQGAFGIVFKAFDEKLHRAVAIKAMSPRLATTSPPRKRFLREARSVAAIKHENIVQVYSVEEQPLPYLVMEYVEGETLQQKLNSVGPLETSEILYLGRQIAAGLAAAHDKGLIHRDIKPGNILLESGVEQKVKITDFGLARAADDATITSTGTIAGTPMYMAPEQALGQNLDHRADLFSLGSVLYQMACGRPPFRGSSTMAVLKRVIDEPARPIQEILPEVPSWLCDIVAKLHCKDPDGRFQSAKELADLFSRCQSEFQLHGKVTAVSKFIQEPSRAENDKPASVDRASRKKNMATFHRMWLTLGGVSAAIVIVGLLLINRGKDKNETANVSAASSTGDTLFENSAEKSRTLPPATWHDWPADAPSPAIAPFDANQAKQYQEAWAKYLGIPIEYTNTLNMRFRLIPPGEFMMGSTQEELDQVLSVIGKDEYWLERVNSEVPRHKVILTKPVYLGIHEVTQAQFEGVMGVNPSKFGPSGESKEAIAGLETADFPVEMVNLKEANEFCAKLSALENLKPYSSDADATATTTDALGYRLPTEAEWEYACRAGTTSKYWNGNQDSDLVRVGWVGTNSAGRTHATGTLLPNPFGLYDMHGNVWEWVGDWWDSGYYSSFGNEPAVNPTGPSNPDAVSYVFRSGNYDSSAIFSRSACRQHFRPVFRGGDIGFRIVLGIDISPNGRQRFKNEIDGDKDRMAALWLTDMKATFFLRTDDKDYTQNDGNPLPDRPFKIVVVDQCRLGINDGNVSNFSGLKQLRGLCLFGSNVTAKGVAKIKDLPKLEILNVDGITLSQSDIASFKRFPRLRDLYLLETGVTDESLVALKELPLLKHLSLEMTEISDQGLQVLEGIPQLQSLTVNRSRVTEAGVKKLAAALPGLKIEYDGGVIERTTE